MAATKNDSVDDSVDDNAVCTLSQEPPRQPQRYTDELRSSAGQQWTRVVNHRFTNELASGTVDVSNVLVPYLVQDHRFLDSFTVLLASTIASIPTLDKRIPLCQFLAVITGPENTYFERSFAKLGVTPQHRLDTPDADVTTKFCNYMQEVATGRRRTARGNTTTTTTTTTTDVDVDIVGCSTLAEKLAVLVVCEWSYLSWGRRVQSQTVRNDFVCYEWVDLHTGPGFESVVEHLRQLLDEEGRKMKDLDDVVGLQTTRRRFMDTVTLEEEFFDYAYSQSHTHSSTLDTANDDSK